MRTTSPAARDGRAAAPLPYSSTLRRYCTGAPSASTWLQEPSETSKTAKAAWQEGRVRSVQGRGGAQP